MKKILSVSLLVLILLTSCATTSYFAGSLGGVYLTSDDYSEELATSEYNNNYNGLKSALWGFFGSKNAPNTNGNKILFYSDLEDDGFYNELVPDRFRATDIDEAGFVIVATEGDPIFYNNYNAGTSQCKVYYGTGILKLYSVKTGKLLYTGTAVKGPTPPEKITVYAGTTSLTYDLPAPSAFKSQISSLCTKIASGSINGSIPDAEAMEAAGAKVPAKSNDVLNIQGIWQASVDDTTIKLIFTDTGLFLFEEWTDGICTYIGSEDYEFKDSVLTIDGYEVDYSYNSKKLSLDYFSSEFLFVQKSKKATDKASANNLLGVWKGGNEYCAYTVGFTKDGFAIYQGSDGEIADYSADNEYVYALGDQNPYHIIDDVLYFFDNGFFWEYDILRFEHLTQKGIDTTSRENIINSNELTYSVESGESGDIYRFYGNGRYTDIPFDEYQRYEQESGTYTYSDHMLYLSDGRELSIAIIDNFYIGSTM